MKKLSTKNIIVIVGLVLLSGITFFSSSAPEAKKDLKGQRAVIVPLVIHKTVRQGGSHSGSSSRSNSGGGSSYGK